MIPLQGCIAIGFFLHTDKQEELPMKVQEVSPTGPFQKLIATQMDINFVMYMCYDPCFFMNGLWL